MPWGAGTHACCVYATEKQRRATVADFFREGAAENDRLLYLVDLDRIVDGAVRALDDAGFHARWAHAGGRLELRSAEDSYLAGGCFDGNRVKELVRRETEAALAAGFRGLRVVGEMSWAARSDTSLSALAAYEAEVNDLFAGATLTGMCQYERGDFAHETLAALVVPHPVVATTASEGDDSGFTAARTEAGRARLSGEVDFADADLLRGFLEGWATASAGTGDLEIDLTGLAFLDVAGLRALVQAAQDLGAGRALAVRGARPLVRKVLALTGWDELPSLRVGPDEPERTHATPQV